VPNSRLAQRKKFCGGDTCENPIWLPLVAKCGFRPFLLVAFVLWSFSGYRRQTPLFDLLAFASTKALFRLQVFLLRKKGGKKTLEATAV